MVHFKEVRSRRTFLSSFHFCFQEAELQDWTSYLSIWKKKPQPLLGGAGGQDQEGHHDGGDGGHVFSWKCNILFYVAFELT